MRHQKARITILHPDLGIGGAERLILDVVAAYKSAGHEVSIVTNHFSETHCFDDALEHKKDIKVIEWFPRSLLGRFCALCAYIRLCLAALYVIFCQDADVIFMDSISLPLIVFWLCSLYSRPRRVFYCHFPDMLLTQRKTVAKRVYRVLVDNLERYSMTFADHIYVNSNFTKKVVYEAFPALKRRGVDVLYPSLRTDALDAHTSANIEHCTPLVPSSFKYVFLSINRYEVKKNLKLAIEALNILRDQLDADIFAQCVLVIAGGYDPINDENKQHYEELTTLADKYNLSENIIFLKSPDDSEKAALLNRCGMVIYTPRFEHFGIVPLEAMYMQRCVLAVNAGGPTETVQHGLTGFLADDTPDKFARYMQRLIDNPVAIAQLGVEGRKRVKSQFSTASFARQLQRDLRVEL